MNLQEIAYPVYRLKNEKPLENDGVFFYAYENYKEEDGEVVKSTVIRILDDKNIDNPKLSMRRLAIRSTGAKIFRLTRAIFFLGDLIKIAKKDMWFIDSSGKLFQYRKTTRCDLKFYKIAKVIAIPTGGAIIEAQGVPARFKSLHYPEPDKLYVGIIHMGMAPILYGFYDKQYKNTWRMV